jgi:hypothetical protein
MSALVQDLHCSCRLWFVFFWVQGCPLLVQDLHSSRLCGFHSSCSRISITCSIPALSLLSVFCVFVVEGCPLAVQDGNMGLVVVATRERTVRAIQKLTQTHMTLSMQTIADRVGLPSAHEAELLLLRHFPR